MKFNSQVFRVVSLIPSGKVTTYGKIAWLLGDGKRARAVGNALHNNPAPVKVPCHRVVDRNGRLAPNFAFDGPGEQRRRLLGEGVKFRDTMHVDLRECLCDMKEFNGRRIILAKGRLWPRRLDETTWS